jgi:arylsulfatase A
MHTWSILLISLQCALGLASAVKPSPNIILIVADDLGYGDLGSYGNPTISTPNIDRLGSDGMKFTQFYVAGPICSPSRSSMLTGKLPVRNGIFANFSYPLDNIVRVFYPSSVYCLDEEEVTLADSLKDNSYSTAMIGKWHLGHNPAHNCLPGNGKQGFDFFYGLPYSHEEGFPGPLPESLVFPPVPLFCDDMYVEQPYNGSDLTTRYTALTQELLWRYAEQQPQNSLSVPGTSAARDARKSRLTSGDSTPLPGLELAYQRLDEGGQDFTKPFFLHLAYENPHVPLFIADEYYENEDGTTSTAPRSRRGLYGDSVEEMDRSIGQVMATLHETGLADNTLVIFTSDNGAWPHPTNGISTREVKGLSIFDGGSNAPFQGGKGSTWEGGMRVPLLLWGGTSGPNPVLPVQARGRIVQSPVSAMDLFPTLLDLLDVPVPASVTDGVSLKPLLTGANSSDPHDCIYLWRERDLYALRCGPYKAHYITRSGFDTSDAGTYYDPPLLFNVEWDPAESIPLTPELDENYDAAMAHVTSMAASHLASVVKAPSKYQHPFNPTVMPCCTQNGTASEASVAERAAILGAMRAEAASVDAAKEADPLGFSLHSPYEDVLPAAYEEFTAQKEQLGIWWDKCVCTRT